MMLAMLDEYDTKALGPATLRKYREAAGLSMAKLSNVASLDHTYISRIESGQRQPSQDVVRRMAKAMQLDADQTAHLYFSFGLIPDGGAVLGEVAELMALCRDSQRYARSIYMLLVVRDALTGRMP